MKRRFRLLVRDPAGKVTVMLGLDSLGHFEQVLRQPAQYKIAFDKAKSLVPQRGPDIVGYVTFSEDFVELARYMFTETDFAQLRTIFRKSQIRAKAT